MIPYNFKPRLYQIPFLSAVDNGVKRAILIWPRRHGKDKTCFNALVKEAFKAVGNYYYIFPEYNQGRKALWDNIDGAGFRTIHHAPKEVIKNTNSTEMKIELLNGSIIQVVGAGDIDRIVGSNPRGVVFSEYSLMDPLVWGYIYPILAENNGFAWFNFTPRGDNHAKQIYTNHLVDQSWFVQRLTAKDCGVFTDEQLVTIKQEYIDLYGDDQLFEQEFMTSFAAPMQGAYYGQLMQRAEEEGKIRSVPYDASVPVNIAWDLGFDDTCALWFYQTVGKEIHFIDYYEMSGEALGHYVNIIKGKPYTYGENYLPHDAGVHELQTGKTRARALKELGLNNLVVLGKTDVSDGIEQVRQFLSRCWFDKEKCDRGLKCLRNYHKEFDEKNKIWRAKPKHDWSSNGADAFRYAAVSYKEVLGGTKKVYDEESLFDEYGNY
jgi:hypothetical protein